MDKNDYTEEYLLSHKDEFETIEYGNLEDVDNCRYQAIFNEQFSYCDIEANATEKWIKVVIFNPDEKNAIRIGSTVWYQPYRIVTNGETAVAKTKLFGDVIIFKLDEQNNYVPKIKEEVK